MISDNTKRALLRAIQIGLVLFAIIALMAEPTEDWSVLMYGFLLIGSKILSFYCFAWAVDIEAKIKGLDK